MKAVYLENQKNIYTVCFSGIGGSSQGLYMSLNIDCEFDRL